MFVPPPTHSITTTMPCSIWILETLQISRNVLKNVFYPRIQRLSPAFGQMAKKDVFVEISLKITFKWSLDDLSVATIDSSFWVATIDSPWGHNGLAIQRHRLPSCFRSDCKKRRYRCISPFYMDIKLLELFLNDLHQNSRSSFSSNRIHYNDNDKHYE